MTWDKFKVWALLKSPFNFHLEFVYILGHFILSWRYATSFISNIQISYRLLYHQLSSLKNIVTISCLQIVLLSSFTNHDENTKYKLCCHLNMKRHKSFVPKNTAAAGTPPKIAGIIPEYMLRKILRSAIAPVSSRALTVQNTEY